MASDGKYMSIYDQRVQLVADAMTQHSKLSKKTAAEVAVHVLHALDQRPEKVR